MSWARFRSSSVVGLSRMMSHRPQTLAQEAPNSAPMRRSSINHRENMYTEVHPILYSSVGYLGVKTTPTIRLNDGQDRAGSALEVGAFLSMQEKINVAG